MRNHLLKSIFISLILVMGVSNAWAVDFTGGKIYFRNDVTNWTTSNIQIFAHQSGYTWVSDPMSKVPDTKLYYINASCNWGGFVNYRICGNSSKWGSGEFTNQSSSTKYTGANNSYGLNGGSIYLITPSSASNGCTISPQYYGSNNDFLKYKATIKVKTSTDGSSYTTISSGNWPATITIKGTYLSGDGKTARNDVATSKGASGSYDAVATGLITMTYSSLNSEYAFVGWGTGNAPSSTSESYEYNIGKATTVYAFFKKKYTITFDANGHGTAPSSQTIIAGAKATKPAEPAEAGYTFGGWYKDADCTSAFDFNTAITDNVTLYAKWTQNATYSLTVVAGANIESVTGSTDPINFGQSYTISATPVFGYKFAEWTAKPAENATIDKAAEATTEVKIQNGSVIVTASATEILAPLTTINSFDAGTPTLAVPTKTATEIGVATTATVTATAAPAGYTFTGWTLENCTSADDLSKKSIEVKSTGTDAAATATAKYEIDKYYVVGSFNGWNTKDDAYKMTYDNGVYKQEVTFVKDVQFKICNGSWAASWSYENLKGIEYKELVKSDDKDQNIKLTKDATFTIIFDLSKHLITFEGLNEKYTYVLMGVNKDWTTGIIMERNPDNPHERMLTCQPIEKANDAIKVAILEEGKDAVYCGEVADHSVSYTLGEHDNIVLEDGVYDFYYKVDEKKVWIGSSTCIPTFEISATASAGGSVTGTNTYAYKEIATLTATADEGYHFEKWSNGSTDNPLKITVTEDIEIQAIFAINTYTITATATKGGTVTGAGTYDHGTSVTLTATPDFDYQFVNWTVGGEVVSTDNPYTFPATANVEVVANFQEVAATTQTISGKFSTGKYEYAEFATGNLQYKKEGENETWRFAKQQYQVVGEQNIELGNPDFKGWIDMFGWSTDATGNNFGVNPSLAKDFYNGNFVDWGTKMGEGWNTLTEDQWRYLLYTRANAANLKQIAYVDTVFGIMLFPDNWKLPSECTVTPTLNHDPEDGENTKYDFYSYNYDLAQWQAMEKAGAVFLPAAGRRCGGYGNMYKIDGTLSGAEYKLQYCTNEMACYWTSSKHSDGQRASALFNLQPIGDKEYKYSTLNLGWYGDNNIGQSVRLAKVTNILIEIGDGDNSDVITDNKDKVVNVKVNRTFKANDGYYTICLPFDIAASEIGKAYQVTSITEHVAEEGFFMVFNEVETIEAGQPYLILPKNLTNPIFENVTITYTGGGETVHAEGAGINFDMVGVINGGGQTDLGQYWVGDNGYFYNGDGTSTTAKLGLRTLFNITDQQGQPVKIRARVVLGENAATGLDNITNGENTTIKVIENGQLIIIRNGEKFNAQGMRF